MSHHAQGWNPDHEVAWNWLWETVERLLSKEGGGAGHLAVFEPHQPEGTSPPPPHVDLQSQAWNP